MYQLRPYQQNAVDAAKAAMSNSLASWLIEAATGCHAKGHKILMHDGSVKNVEDVVVGDDVMGPDSMPRKVIALHTGKEMMYKVSPTKGEPFIVNGGHILSLYKTPKRKGMEPGYSEISLFDYVKKDKTFKHMHKLEYVAVDFDSKPFVLSPWFVGVMIGDGCITGTSQYTLCNPDHEVITGVEAEVKRLGCDSWISLDNRLAATVKFRGYANIVNEMKSLGLHGTSSSTKFIPEIYKMNNKRVRLEMLAGLLDTDGCLSRSGYDWISKSKQLADDVVYICRSVGLAAYVSECEKSCQNDFTGNYYRVSISGDCSIIPCRVSRRVAMPRRQIKNHMVTGFSVAEVGLGDYYGFEVDCDHLYLDAEFIRHHNSGKSLMVAEIAKWLKEKSGKKVLCLAPSKELTEQNFEKYLAYGNPASIWSASAGKKCLKHDVVFGTPKSVVNDIEKFGAQFAAIIIDEAHGITPTIKKIVNHIKQCNPNVRIGGLTATPYRMGTGYIYAVDENNISLEEEETINPFFDKLIYKITAHELIDQGFLTPPVADAKISDKYDTSNLIIKNNGMFDTASVEQAFEGKGRKTAAIVSEVVALSQHKMGVMFFAATIQHAEEIMQSLPNDRARIVTGKTGSKERSDIIESFKRRDFKYLVNVSVLTTGFDAPHVDVVAVLRATESASLFQQIVGRGLRLHPDKSTCLVLDYADNIGFHNLEDDMFSPKIRTRIGSSESYTVEATCARCGTVNEFSGRPNPEKFEIDSEGYFVDLAGERIETDDGQFMPAHFGRRCNYNYLAKDGLQRCDQRWSMKVCPECETENDIAARYCSNRDCRAELVDPNTKLLLDYKKMKSNPSILSTDKVIAWRYQDWTSKKGGRSLRVDYTTEYRSFPVWYNPDASNLRAQALWQDFSQAVFGLGKIATGIDHFLDAMSRNVGKMPETITSKKNGDFFNVYMHNQPCDRVPE